MKRLIITLLTLAALGCSLKYKELETQPTTTNLTQFASWITVTRVGDSCVMSLKFKNGRLVEESLDRSICLEAQTWLAGEEAARQQLKRQTEEKKPDQ